MKVDILVGDDAQRSLADDAFLKAWQSLHARCAWATVCQGVEFCKAWYEAYKNSFTPLLVKGVDEKGELVGLLTMAVGVGTGEIIAAGANQAEYHVWLATPEAGETFIEAALADLGEKFPGRFVRFLFLPPGSPLGWIGRARARGGRCDLQTIPRALMATGDEGKFRDSLRKKSNKSRINRLARAGELRLKVLSDTHELEEVFDEIMTYDRFRLGAIHRVPVPPQPDSLKRAFYVRMMQSPRLLHATVLMAGDEIASAHIGHYNGEQVMLGVLAHSPFFAKHSPSKIHVLMLGELLAKEGITAFDLTPGGEYKERFATHHDDAYVLTVFFGRARHLRHRATRKTATAAKRLLDAAGITPSQFKNVLERARHKAKHLKVGSLPAKALGKLAREAGRTAEMRVYRMDVGAVKDVPRPPQLMRRDYLPDLMAFETAEAWQPPVHGFLAQALEKLEGGMHAYTRAEDGRLLHYGWLVERQAKSSLSEVGQELRLPPDSAVLADFYTHPSARGRGMYRNSLCQMLHDAAAVPGTKHVYICVMADNRPSRRVIEKVGFVYQHSFFERRKFGRVARWSNATEPAAGPPGEEDV